MERAVSEKLYMKIGDLARVAGVTPRALRYYEELNLLQATRTTECGTRLYSPSALVSLENILVLKEIGFSLSEIQQMAEWVRGVDLDERQRDTSLSLIDKKLEKLEADSERLREVKSQLRRPRLVQTN